MSLDLSKYDNSWYNPGRSFLIRIIWYSINAFFLQNRFNPSSWVKIFLLRIFGAKVGEGVVLKPSINVKYPWNLEIGDYSWVGEKVWLDSLAPIKIGRNCCVSQGVYFCTGSHDWSDPAFELIIKPIIVENGVWVGAQSILLPGITLGSHSVVAAGSVISQNAEPYMVYAGNPAEVLKKREIRRKENL